MSTIFSENRAVGRATLGLIGTAGVLILLEGVAWAGLVNPNYLPPPSQVVGELFVQLGSADFWRAVGATMEGWAIGLLIALAIALPLAALIGSSEYVYRATRPVVEFLRPVPSVALIPVAILIFGPNMGSKVFLVAFGCLWPLLIQLVYGLRDIEPTQVETARSFRVSSGRRITRITLPSILPYLATGLRLAVSIALVLAVTAELVTGSEGLGQAIMYAQNSGAVTTMYAIIVATGLIGVVLSFSLAAVERRVLKWHPSQREVVR